MSLSSAFNIINSAFNANAAQTAVISNNVSNSATAGYSLKTANLAFSPYGGVDVTSITRATNTALQEQMLAANSQSAAQSALADGLTQLSATVSDNASTSSTATTATASGQSPAAMLASLESALQTYAASPTNPAVAAAVTTAAGQLTASLNNATTTVQQVRSQADAGMAQSVTTINSLLTQFQTANDAVVTGLNAGVDVTSAEDTRDNLLSQLSQQVGISTVTAPNGSMAIYTDSGVTLFQNSPRTVTFTATPTLIAGATGSAVTVDGVAITGAASPMAIHSGALAGLATLRDTTAPQYQAQLDQIASALVNAFAETDQTTPATPNPLPGLFTYPSFTVAGGLPVDTSVPPGLAGQIEVNPTVDPTQGGNVDLLRDGDISGGGANYTYNTTGAASYTTRIQQMISQISASQSFDPAAGAGSTASLSGYAADSVSWIQGQYQQASEQATNSGALATTASQALSSATGVNLDQQTSQMLSLENSYQTTAKLLTTVNNMFSSLLTAVAAVAAA